MKKLILTAVIALAIISCAPPETSSKAIGLTGVWDRIGTVNYEDGKPKDTLAFDAKFKQVKVYSAGYFMFVSNGEQMDSLGVDQFIGFAGNGKYEVKNDSLIEYMSHGTDNYLKWTQGGNNVYRVKLSLSESHYSQYWLDSLGKGRGELYKRIE